MGILNDIRELFFPRCCVVCGKRLLQGEEFMCFSCMQVLPRTNLHLSADNEVAKSFWGKFPVERASAFLYYSKGGPVRRLLYDLKYYGNYKLGHFLGRYMASELSLSGFFAGIDYIVPVPMFAQKRKSRGYNQSEMLAEGISSVTCIPLLRNGLVKNRQTETQTHKSSYERWKNVRDVFECVSFAEMNGKHILLVDDVLTTGATIVACADALGKVSGLRISILTLAMAGDS